MERHAAANPPETLEGWYALHQIFTVDRTARRQVADARIADALSVAPENGWSQLVDLIGSTADLMVIHFRQTLDDIAHAQKWAAASGLLDVLQPT